MKQITFWEKHQTLLQKCANLSNKCGVKILVSSDSFVYRVFLWYKNIPQCIISGPDEFCKHPAYQQTLDIDKQTGNVWVTDTRRTNVSFHSFSQEEEVKQAQSGPQFHEQDQQPHTSFSCEFQCIYRRFCGSNALPLHTCVVQCRRSQGYEGAPSVGDAKQVQVWRACHTVGSENRTLQEEVCFDLNVPGSCGSSRCEEAYESIHRKKSFQWCESTPPYAGQSTSTYVHCIGVGRHEIYVSLQADPVGPPSLVLWVEVWIIPIKDSETINRYCAGLRASSWGTVGLSRREEIAILTLRDLCSGGCS